MKRREILKYTAFVSGTAIFAPLASSLVSSCSRKPVEDAIGYVPRFFTEDQLRLVMRFADTILPRTETPSATDVGVHITIDGIVADVYNEQDTENYKSGFGKLEEYLKTKEFIQANPEDREQIILEIESDESISSEIRDSYFHLKQQTIAFFLSSEEIGENVLNYLPVPGAYEPCISLEETGGKRWSL